MDNPHSHQLSPAAMKLVLSELDSMRDALVQLSLALNDYKFYVEANGLSTSALEVEVALSRVLAKTKPTS